MNIIANILEFFFKEIFFNEIYLLKLHYKKMSLCEPVLDKVRISLSLSIL